MHSLFEQAAGMTHDVIGAAIEVHKDKGPGLLESIYEWCFSRELELRGYEVRSQKSVVVRYKDFEREEPLKFDVLVNGCLPVEIKAVQNIEKLTEGRQSRGPQPPGLEGSQFPCKSQ